MVDAGTVIFFAEPVPEALESLSIIHRPTTPLQHDLRPGDIIHLGAVTLPIRAVGDIASSNVRELGHLVLYCDGATEASLPGAVHVDPGRPEVAVGDTIAIEDGPQGS